jgi:hypothetical protein
MQKICWKFNLFLGTSQYMNFQYLRLSMALECAKIPVQAIAVMDTCHVHKEKTRWAARSRTSACPNRVRRSRIHGIPKRFYDPYKSIGLNWPYSRFGAKIKRIFFVWKG